MVLRAFRLKRPERSRMIHICPPTSIAVARWGMEDISAHARRSWSRPSGGALHASGRMHHCHAGPRAGSLRLLQESRMKPVSFRYHSPKTLDEAVALLAEVAPQDGRVLAGGQSL